MSWLKRNPIAMIIKRGSEAIDSLIEAVETLLGQRGDPLDRVVTFRDLYTAGVTGLKDTSGQVRYWNGPVSVPLVPVTGTGASDLSGYPAVSAPTALTVDSTLSANILSWDTPDTPRYAYTKVFRADTDNYAAATEIGASGGGFYYDLLGAGGISKYYWIRHTDIEGLDTALNDTDGTLGTTGYLTDPDIQDGTIHGGKVQTGTLAADRIAAGTMNAIITYTGEMEISSSGFIESSNYSAGVSGYRISATTSEFNNVTVRGVLAAVTGTLGTLTMASGGYIASANYSVGTTGWKISDTGAELNNATIKAASGTLGTLIMATGGYIQSSNYSVGTTGWKLSETGIEFNTGLTVAYADVTGTKPPANADNTTSAINSGTTVTSGGITFNAGGAIKGGQTDYNTGTGWFLGYSGGAYKFSIGNPSGNYLKWDGTGLSYNGSLTDARSYTAGDIVIGSSCSISTFGQTPPSYAKVKEIYVPGSGTLRVKFKLRSNATSGSVDAYGKVYKDGTAIGTERSNSRLISEDFIEYSEDLTISSAGYVQLYVKNSNTVGLATQTKDFKVSCGFLTFPCVETQANHPFE